MKEKKKKRLRITFNYSSSSSRLHRVSPFFGVVALPNRGCNSSAKVHHHYNHLFKSCHAKLRYRISVHQRKSRLICQENGQHAVQDPNKDEWQSQNHSIKYASIHVGDGIDSCGCEQAEPDVDNEDKQEDNDACLGKLVTRGSLRGAI